jgi:hypothetical protein
MVLCSLGRPWGEPCRLAYGGPKLGCIPPAMQRAVPTGAGRELELFESHVVWAGLTSIRWGTAGLVACCSLACFSSPDVVGQFGDIRGDIRGYPRHRKARPGQAGAVPRPRPSSRAGAVDRAEERHGCDGVVPLRLDGRMGRNPGTSERARASQQATGGGNSTGTRRVKDSRLTLSRRARRPNRAWYRWFGRPAVARFCLGRAQGPEPSRGSS